jgi:hypothetical protein
LWRYRRYWRCSRRYGVVGVIGVVSVIVLLALRRYRSCRRYWCYGVIGGVNVIGVVALMIRPILILGFHRRHKSDGGSTRKQNTVIRVSRLFSLCIRLVFHSTLQIHPILHQFLTPVQHKHPNIFQVHPLSHSPHNAV